MKKYLKNVICAIVLLAVTGCVGYLCFAYLGKPGTNNTDEARHIANAYEMLRNGDFWISSYRGATDYFNYKPPLSMWCIMLNFALFGINSFTMRMYSAISFVLLFVILSVFCWKKFSPIVAAVWGIPLICMNDIFFFHCARHADADALYLLMFSVGMIFLYLAKEKPKCLMGFGFFMSLAFMAKCLHVASAAVIFVLFLPAIWKKAKINDYILMVISAIIPTGVWLLVRYSFDGFTFITGMFSQEVADKIETGKGYFDFVKYFATFPAIIIITVVALGVCVISIIQMIKNKPDVKMKVFQRIINSPSYFFVLWAMVPFLIYSASGQFAMWYGYICYIPLCVLFGMSMDFLCSLNNLVIKAIVLAVSFGGLCWALVSIVPTYVTDFKYMKEDGNVGNVYLRRDLEKLITEHPEVRGYNIYLENLNQEYAAQNEWEVSGVADAYITGDFTPLDGGVPMFIDDANSILIISKDLFENYYDTLVGRVILEEGEYFVFDHKYYGEE